MADISKIKIPSGDVYDLKDDTARGLLENKIGFDQPVQIGQTEYSMILSNDENDGIWLTIDNGVEDEDSYQLINNQGIIQIPKRQEIPTVPNSFGTVKVGTTDLVADAQSDTLTVTAGNNITLTPNATNDSFSIAATDTTYDAATAAPLMNGTAAVGSSIKYARQDHVHPSDTTKADIASLLPVKATASYNGLTIIFLRVAGTVHVTIRGTLTEQIATNSAYANICDIPVGFRPSADEYHLWYQVMGALYYGQVTCTTNKNKIQFGYTRKMADGTTTALPSGAALYMRFSYACDNGAEGSSITNADTTGY